MKQSSSNECSFLQHSIPFSVQRGCPRADILHTISILLKSFSPKCDYCMLYILFNFCELFLADMTQMDNIEIGYYVRSSSTHPYISLEAYENLKQQWMYPFRAHPPVSCAEEVLT